MNIGKKIACLIFPLFAIFGCDNSNKVKIKANKIEQVCNISCFRGLKSDMYYQDLVAIVGEPNEIYAKVAEDEFDEDYYDPVYYYQEGKIRCYWSGQKEDPIGVIEYTPYLNFNIQIDDFIKAPYRYNINSETDVVSVIKDDTLFYVVYLDSLRIKKIKYWGVED